MGAKPGRKWVVAASVLAVGLVSACGGRSANVTPTASPLDSRLSCDHLTAERIANLRRIDDLRDERIDNRIRSLSRVPGAIIGNPLSAIVLADPSIAIYREIGGLESRNARIAQLKIEKGCVEA